MSQVQLSPLSIYKNVDGNRRGVESGVLRLLQGREAIFQIVSRQGYAVPFVPLASFDPVGDGNDAEAAKS